VQDLYRGEGVMRAPDNPDRPASDYVAQSRRRQLGGSGLIWGGKCVALDPADFARRDWVKGSGWPLSRAQLQPFYDRACDLLEIPHFAPGETALADPVRPELKLDNGRRWFSAPRHYSKYSGASDAKAYDRWRTGPMAAANVTCWLNANVTEIRLASDGRAIERLDIACLNGLRHTARGRAYVLATGGIENARLLLASNSVEKAGVGNRADLVGRYFQGHVTYGVGVAPNASVFFSGPAQDLRLYADGSRGKSHCVLAPRLAEQRRLRVGNSTVTLTPMAPPAQDGEFSALQTLANGIDAGAGEPRGEQSSGCFFMNEHLPNPDSRVTLGATSDALGMPRVRLEWRYQAQDWRNLEATVAAFAAEMGGSGLGRLCFPAERPRFLAIASPSRHHMGTTRTSADPGEGVVDTDGRVHGVVNLYVAGSSIFPTSGIGNPTLTLLAYAMRLSDHLKSDLRRTA
jgi:choline dehydrogenase-like flavoprotein